MFNLSSYLVMELLRIKNLRGGEFGIDSGEIHSLLREVMKEHPDKGRMYYINAVYSRLLDRYRPVEHTLRTTGYFNLIADYLIFFMKQHGN